MTEIEIKNLENRYIKEFKKFLPLGIKNREKILSTVREGIHNYICDHDISDYETLIAGFGAPQATADDYVNESPGKVRLNARKTIVLIIIISIILLLSITSTIAYYYYEQTPAYIIIETAGEVETFPNDVN